MNRVAVQEGYVLPFAGTARRFKRRRKTSHKRKGTGGSGKSKMRACARRWHHYRGAAKYRTFVKFCMKTGHAPPSRKKRRSRR